MKNQGRRRHDTSLCSGCKRKNPAESSAARDRCSTQNTHSAPSASHPPQSQPCRGSSHPTLLPAPPASALLCFHPSHFTGRSLKVLEIPTFLSKSNILGKSTIFSSITLRICINTLVLCANKIYQELLIPNFTLSPTFSLQPLSPQVPKMLTTRINYKAG